MISIRSYIGSALRRFKVRWKGYGEDDDTWEPRSHLPPHLIKEFLLANELYDFNWPGERCPLCDKPCKNARGVKCHMRHCYFNTVAEDRQQDFRHRKAEKAAITQKKEGCSKAQRESGVQR